MPLPLTEDSLAPNLDFPAPAFGISQGPWTPEEEEGVEKPEVGYSLLLGTAASRLPRRAELESTGLCVYADTHVPKCVYVHIDINVYIRVCMCVRVFYEAMSSHWFSRTPSSRSQGSS